MQRFYRPLFTMCIAMLCIFFVPSKVQAANYTPAQVTGLKATAGESQVSLKWKKVTGAAGYEVYRSTTVGRDRRCHEGDC